MQIQYYTFIFINKINEGDHLKLTSIGADVSGNDVSCSQNMIKNIEKDIPKLTRYWSI